MESLKEKTAKGLFWGALNNGVTQLLGMLFGILLGRLLTPEDYSMMTMIAVFSQIAAILQSSGFTAALVNLKNPTHEDYNSVFWFNIFAGLFLYTVLFSALRSSPPTTAIPSCYGFAAMPSWAFSLPTSAQPKAHGCKRTCE